MAKPDYETWDKASEFTPAEAAALCCDQEPPRTRMYDPAIEAMKARLASAVPTHPKLVVLRGVKTTQRVHSREALRAWAQGHGELAAMPFLQTREERISGVLTPQRGGNDGSEADTRDATRTLVGLLTLALAEVGGDDFTSLADGERVPNLWSIAHKLAVLAEDAGINLAGLKERELRELLQDGQDAVIDRRV